MENQAVAATDIKDESAAERLSRSVSSLAKLLLKKVWKQYPGIGAKF